MFVLIWMNFLRHDEHFDNVFNSYSEALCPAHAAPHAGGQHQSYVPFRIVSVGRYVPLYHNTVPYTLHALTRLDSRTLRTVNVLVLLDFSTKNAY